MNALGLPPELNVATAMGLLMQCPTHGGNPEHCPLHELRRLSRMDQFQWVCNSSPNELEAMLAKCARCRGCGAELPAGGLGSLGTAAA